MILAAGNRLRRVRDVKAEGGRVFDCVVARKLKIDRKTKKLLNLNGFKSRINLSGDQQAAILKALGELPARGRHAAVADDTAVKVAFSVIAEHKLACITADLPNAYCAAERKRPACGLRIPRTLRWQDEDGEELCVWLVTPVYGEEAAGDELDETVVDEIEALGWQPIDVAPAVHTMLSPAGPTMLLRIVDDFLIAFPQGTEYGLRTVAALETAFGPGVKWHHGCNDIAGYCVAYDMARGIVTMRMNVHVENAVARFEPELLKGVRPSAELPPQSRKGALDKLCEGLYLPDDRSAPLTADQKYVQEVTGALKFPERVKPRLTRKLWLLARVMSYPYPIADAKMAARLLLELALDYVDEGITFGGDVGPDSNPRLAVHMTGALDLDKPAPPELEGHADTTWNKDPDCYAAIVTRNRGAVLHGVWKFTMTCDASQLAEAVGTCFLAERVALVQEFERGLGIATDVPAVITTDSTSNWQVATRRASANKSRHALRRWRVLRERLEARECKLVHLPGVSMPADFLTKRTDAKRVNAGVAYATNAENALPFDFKAA